MFLADDILCAPFKGILWIFREIHERAREEMAAESESIALQLRNLYMQLESSTISEQEFEAREKTLLDRLDEIEARDGEEEAREEMPNVHTR